MKTQKIIFKVEPKDKADLKKQASKLGVSMSKLIRSKLLTNFMNY